jgi:hypothetical protein
VLMSIGGREQLHGCDRGLPVQPIVPVPSGDF